jgi:thiol-disulfide isomerase/thioredoxin
VILSGCGRNDLADDAGAMAQPGATPGGEAGHTAAPPRTTAAAIVLQETDWAGVETQIAQQAGRVVVLDVWSTYCPPCIKELPELARLKRDLGTAIGCVTLNCDNTGEESLEQLSPRVDQYLQRADLAVADAHLVSRQTDQELFEILEVPSIPVVRVYDQSGVLVQQFDNQDRKYGPTGFSYREHVRPLVERLLRGEPAAATEAEPRAEL